MPQILVLPKFCRCRVFGGDGKVTFETGFFTRLLNHVVRHVRLRRGARFTPASPPNRRSGPRFSFANVRAAPAMKVRYNSFRVGARKPQLAPPHTETLSASR